MRMGWRGVCLHGAPLVLFVLKKVEQCRLVLLQIAEEEACTASTPSDSTNLGWWVEGIGDLESKTWSLMTSLDRGRGDLECTFDRILGQILKIKQVAGIRT